MNKKLSTLLMAILALVISTGAVASAETITLSEHPDERPTRLVGPIDEIVSSELWTVAGVPVHISAETRIDERMETAPDSRWVRVDGVGDGSGGLQAMRIKLLPPQRFIRLQGDLSTLDTASLTVDGIVLATSPSTHLVGDPQPGEDRVRVQAALLPEGGLLALQVRRIGAGDEWLDHPDPEDLERGNGVKLIGIVQTIDETDPTMLQVSGVKVIALAESNVDERVGPVVVGGWVRIDGRVNQEGALLSKRLRTMESQEHHRVEGILQSFDTESLTVGGITILTDSETELEGNPQIGKLAEVKARLNDEGQLVAVEVEREGDRPNSPGVHRFQGRIESLPADSLFGEWIVGDRPIQVVEDVTLIDESKGLVEVGARVLVEGRVNGEGQFVAREIRTLADNRPQNPAVRFIGVIDELPAEGLIGLWLVDGKSVRVTEQTELEGDQSFNVGDRVKVKGYRGPENVVLAREIEHEDEEDEEDRGEKVDFEAAIVSFPPGLVGEWQVGDRRVLAGPNTEFRQEEGSFAVGVVVRVKGIQGEDGVVGAHRIETESD